MQDHQEFFDSLPKRAASANVIIENTHGQLLVVKAHYKPYWSLPGGWIEVDDTPRQAAVREVHEEVGLELRADELEFAGLIDRMTDTADTYLFIFRLIDPIESSTVLRLQADEIAAYDWVSRDEINQKTRGHYNTAVKNWADTRPQTYIERKV